MNDTFYSFDISAGWVILIILIAAGLAFLLYSKKDIPWHKNLSVLLGFLRFTSLLLLGLLLLNPILRLAVNEEDDPIFLIVNDNSSSVSMRMEQGTLADISGKISDLQNKMDHNYQVASYDLEERSDTLSFDQPSSNLSSIFKLFESAYDGKNVGGILFLSDGIYNEGLSPAYLNYPYPVYTVGMGDTIPPRDISIKEVRHNRVAYQGNKFPVRLLIEQRGFSNQLVKINIRESGNLVANKTVRLSDALTDVDFELEANSSSLLHLTITIPGVDGESTLENNKKDIFIEIIEGKEKVLIISPAPHPDIKAIRQTLSETGNYETIIYIPGIYEPQKEETYDVIIEYAPFRKPIRHAYKSSGKWLILDSKSRVNEINKLPFLKIDTRGNQKDLVRPAINKSFRKFELNENNLDHFIQVPPVEVYFGDYELNGPTDILLFQKVGSIETTKPLMFFYDDGSQKTAVNIGTGLWQWRLQEAALQENSDLFDELILKTIQFLSIRTNKERFTANARQSVYQEGDRIFIDTQVYDEIFERSYGNSITLSISSEEGETRTYELVDSPLNSAFNIGTLKQGIYKYQAKVLGTGEPLLDQGEFLVESLQIEALDLTANHNLLKQVSQKSNGKFYHYSQLEQLEADLSAKSFQSIIRTRESYFPLINSLWIIAVICILLFSEWFMRKYFGLY